MEITITGADQWTNEIKIGPSRLWDVRICAPSGWTGSVIVQRRRSDQPDWFPVEDMTFDGTAQIDRTGESGSSHWFYRIGSPDGAGSIRAGIWSN